MARKCFSLYLSVCLIATLFAFSSFPVSAKESLSPNNDSPVTLEQANQVLRSSSNFFTENKGQWPEEILFMGDTDFGKVAFTQEAVYYQLVKTTHTTKDCLDQNGAVNQQGSEVEEMSQEITQPWSDIDRLDEFTTSPIVETQTIKLSFVNAQTPTIQGKTLLPHYNNYFIGNDPDHWGIHCNNYTQVNYTNVWDNIDLSYFFTPQGMKYEYYVHPGADIQDVQVQVVGADLLSNEQSLELRTLLGNLKDDQLYVYGQDSLLTTLKASFQVHNDIFSFDVEDDVCRDETIVIDPVVYSTYLGGNEEENLWECTTDIYDNIYLTGWTWSANFPTINPFDISYGGNADIFLTKIDVSKNTLAYSTYIGGLGSDETYAICIDEFENAFIGGRAKSSDFPIFPLDNIPGYCKTHFGGEGDAFLIKLNSAGTAFLFSTFMGGSVDDTISDIVLDSDNNVYVCGSSTSPNFPIHPSDGIIGAYKSFSGSRDGFVIKLNQDGSQFLYSSYIGGSNWEYCEAIKCNDNGTVYIGGGTFSNDFPTTFDAYQKINKGGLDLYIVKLDTNNMDIIFSTLLGGNSWEYIECGNSFEVDQYDCLYLAGYTQSPQDQGFPIGGSIPGYDITYNGSGDGFIIKLNPSGTQVLYSTYIGGTEYDSIINVRLDSTGCICVTGQTKSGESSFPVGGSIKTFDPIYNGNTDSFFIKLNQDGSNILFSTYIGGIGTDIGKSLALDSKYDAYIAGNTNSLESSFPIGNEIQGYDQTLNGGYDAFLVKLDLPKPLLELNVSADASSYKEGTQPILTITLSNIGNDYAHSCEVLVTLPPQLQFLEDQLIVSTPAPNNSRLFQAGGLPAGGSIAFPVFTEVIENVPTDTTVTLYFDASCAEHATANTHLYIDLLHIDTTPPCPSLFLETTPNKPNYYYGDLVYLNVTLRNLGGPATNVKLELDLPPDLSYAGCDQYRATGQGNHQSFAIGTMDADSTLRFVIYAKVITDVKVAKSIPILLELTAKECDSFARRLLNIKLEPKRTGQQNLDLSVKLLNLEFDTETGQYYLPFDRTLELQLQVSGYETYYNYTIHWGDGETTTLKNETSATILLNHNYTAKGSMHIKITIQDPNGREKTSTLYLTVK